LSSYPFRVAGQPVANRRHQDRRHLLDAGVVSSPENPRRRAILWGLLLTALSFSAWQWRYLAYGPAWLARSRAADHSDLYVGKTNGISNLILTQQARNYLPDIDHLDASGNVSEPAFLKPLGVHIDMAWFTKHAPDRVDFNPFISSGAFVVTWLYYPGCQKTVKISSRSDTDWYSARGRPCFPACKLTVRMAPNLRLTSININPA
jgi:hypothetical protein